MSETRKTIVQFGAGNIGRSLAGQLFSKAGYEVIFVDAVPAIIDALNARGSYIVRVKDTLPPGQSDEIRVDNVRGLMAQDAEAVAEAVAKADIIGTSVGPNVLPKILPTIAKGLQMRQTPVSMLMCENLRNAAAFVRERIIPLLPADFDLAGRLGLVETSIGKMVPIMPNEMREIDPLEVWAEAYNQIIADVEGFIGEPPQVKGLVLKKSFAAYVDRKLFIHNLGHATAAYHGFLAGKTRIWECVEDPAIRQQVRGAMWESGRALIAQYPGEFNEQNQGEHIEDLLNRFGNKALGDTVFRVGRDLMRKVSPEDRCIGALRLAIAKGVEPVNICRSIAAALLFKAVDESGNMFPDDARFQAELDAKGPEAMLIEVGGMDAKADRKVLDIIIGHYEALKNQFAA